MVKYSLLRTMAFFFIGLVGFSTVTYAEAMTRLSTKDLYDLCTRESSVDKLNCEVSIRATGERLQIGRVYFGKPCRNYPISINDASRIGHMLSSKALDEDAYSTIEVMNYWAEYADGVPCANQPLWSAQKLLEECQSDNRGRSPCMFYTHALLEFVNITDIINKRGPTYCPPTNVIMSYDIANAYIGWLQRHPNMNQIPAAYALVAALAEYYPCTPPTR